MSEKILHKIGYYTVYEIKDKLKTSYRVDSGKKIHIQRFNKTIINPYRDVKNFDTIEKADKYASFKMESKSKTYKSSKSVYLVLIKEESTGKTFVKVGYTSKKFIIKRFSKLYGYGGYVVESILRRIDTIDAEDVEREIKDKINKKRSIKKYRPVLESFSGYSECYDYLSLNDVINIFDGVIKKYV